MPITKRMTAFLFLFAAALLLLNLGFYGYVRLHEHKADKVWLLETTRQVGLTLSQSQSAMAYAKVQIEQELRTAAELAAKELSPELKQVTADQLADLSRRTGVSGFSLLYKLDDAIVTGPSTESDETTLPGHSLHKEDKNYNTFNDLLGQAYNLQPNPSGLFWTASGEEENGTSDPALAPDHAPASLDGSGFYFDGQRNYIIHVFLHEDDLTPEIKRANPQNAVDQIMRNTPGIVEITGWPVGPADGLKENSGTAAMPVLFGTSRFKDSRTAELLSSAANGGSGIVSDLYQNGKHYLQSYVKMQTLPDEPYVLRVIYDRDAVKGSGLPGYGYVLFPAALLMLVALMSVLFSQQFARPFRQLLKSVKAAADGDSTAVLPTAKMDEFGLLAVYVNGLIGNIGEQKEAVNQMSEENSSISLYLDSIISQTADAIYISDSEGKVIRANQAFETLYGWTEEEVVGQPLPFVPDWYMEEYRKRQVMLAKGQTLPWTETIRLCKDGSEVAVSISESPVFDQDGNIVAYTTISKDMTEYNKLEELLRRSEKLSTVGQLAAGVAHEIRNPLTTLRGFLQLQQQTKALNLKHVDIMLAELDRINVIVGEFLILAKPKASIFEDKDIRYILGDVVSLLDSQAHLFGVEFVLDFSKESLYVHCEENQLKQVFINILKNAIEAMPLGGGIGLKVMREGGNVLIGIIDEGEGIPYETLPKLGEPFFTSKEKGTGLGLMVSQRIIEAHKGTVTINSMLGWGTMVTISLPLVETKESKEAVLKDQEE